MFEVRELVRQLACKVTDYRQTARAEGEVHAWFCLNLVLDSMEPLMEHVAPRCGACAIDFYTGYGGYEHDEFCEFREAEEVEVVFGVPSN